MNLDVTPEGSKFYSYIKYQIDSTMHADIKKQLQGISGNAKISSVNLKKPNVKGGNISYMVEKIYPDYKVIYHDKLGSDSYKVLEDRTMEWAISPDKTKVGEWEAQKATTNFAGRQWTSWFTTDIPIPDGPYKFHGLPGLIVKMQDSKNDFNFELKATEPIKGALPDLLNNKEVSVDRTQFVKLFREHRKDPVKSLRMLINSNASSGGSVKIVKNGREISSDEMLRNIERKQRLKIKSKNTYIEQDWLEN